MEWIVGSFGLVLTALGTILLVYFKDMRRDIGTISASMVGMNIKLEKVITDQTWHKEEIGDVKTDIKDIYGRLNALKH